MSLTRQMVRLIRAKTVSDADLQAAALFVLDTAASALGGVKTEPARIIARVAPLEKGDTARRAFYFGGLSHILEMDDLHRDSVTHPGCVVIPAAWALAEEHDLGGHAFLKAVLAGYEACCRVGMAVGKEHYRVFHNTSTCGPFGSAMASAELLGLDEEQAVWALGNAGTQASGFWEFLAAGAMSKHLHTARGAESGVLAGLLAKEGFTGPELILEGEKGFFAGLCKDPMPEAVTAKPDGEWELTRTSIKPWPCCRHTHPLIDAAMELHGQLAGAEVACITVGAYRAALDVCDRPRPEDGYGAKFSLQHCAAIALREGEVGLESFDAHARGRASTLLDRVEVMLDAEVDAAYPKAWGVRLTVETADGRRLEAFRRHAKGDPENPVSAEELARKARMLMIGGGMGEPEAGAVVDAILSLADDRPVRELALFRQVPAVRVARLA